jgi:uncharacterized protein YkwD
VSFQTPYVTRAETVMILLQSRLRNVPNVRLDEAIPDVKPGQWYERYIALGAKFKIIETDPQTLKMRPDDPVTRSEFLKMAARTFALPENLPYLYQDVQPGGWPAAYAGIARAYRLFPRDANQNLLQPGQVMTHEEMVAALQAIIKQKQSTTPDYRNAILTPPIPPPPPPPTVTQRTSTEQEQITILKPQGSVPKPTGPVLLTGPAIDPTFDASTLPYLRSAVIAIVNRERAVRGLRPVKENAALDQSAQIYAERMAKDSFFSHVAPDGQTFRDRVEASGYYRLFFEQDCLCLGRYMMAENIARGQKTADEVMRDWMNSPEHKAAILTKDFTDIGIGVRAGLWVQHFGTLQHSDNLSQQ